MSSQKKYLVLVAGGNGSRMNNGLPKQFLSVRQKPILFYTINTFLTAFEDLMIILVLPKEYIFKGEEIIATYFDKKNIAIVEGGKTRFESVKNGLSYIKEESVIFVHDAVRCLLTKDLILRCHSQALEKGSAIPAIESKDSVRIVENGSNKAIDRSAVRLIQTPQVFLSKILLPAFTSPYKDFFTDEASVVEYAGNLIHLIEGEENNIKITYPMDLVLAEKILAI